MRSRRMSAIIPKSFTSVLVPLNFYAGKPVAAYGKGDKGAELAVMMKHWMSDVVDCSDGTEVSAKAIHDFILGKLALQPFAQGLPEGAIVSSTMTSTTAMLSFSVPPLLCHRPCPPQKAVRAAEPFRQFFEEAVKPALALADRPAVAGFSRHKDFHELKAAGAHDALHCRLPPSQPANVKEVGSHAALRHKDWAASFMRRPRVIQCLGLFGTLFDCLGHLSN